MAYRFGAKESVHFVYIGPGGPRYRLGNAVPPMAPRSRTKRPALSGANDNDGSIDGDEPAAASSPEAAAAEIGRRRRRLPLFSVSLLAGAVVCVAIKPLIAIIAAFGLLVALPADARQKRVPIYYEMDQQAQKPIDTFYNALDEVARARAVWHLPQESFPEEDARQPSSEDSRLSGPVAYYHRSYTRKAIRPIYTTPPFLRTNVAALRIPTGLRTLYFMPDRLYVQDNTGVVSVGYDALQVHMDQVVHVEDEEVPEGAQVVGTRWKHETQQGRADRRYKKNHQVPLVQYCRIWFSDGNGLKEVIQLSTAALEYDLAAALKAASRVGTADWFPPA